MFLGQSKEKLLPLTCKLYSKLDEDGRPFVSLQITGYKDNFGNLKPIENNETLYSVVMDRIGNKKVTIDGSDHYLSNLITGHRQNPRGNATLPHITILFVHNFSKNKEIQEQQIKRANNLAENENPTIFDVNLVLKPNIIAGKSTIPRDKVNIQDGGTYISIPRGIQGTAQTTMTLEIEQGELDQKLITFVNNEILQDKSNEFKGTTRLGQDGKPMVIPFHITAGQNEKPLHDLVADVVQQPS